LSTLPVLLVVRLKVKPHLSAFKRCFSTSNASIVLLMVEWFDRAQGMCARCSDSKLCAARQSDSPQHAPSRFSMRLQMTARESVNALFP
jgi:hypothetical protein